MRFRDASLKLKLTLITMLTSSVALLLAAAGFVAYELQTFRGSMADELHALAGIVGANSRSSLAFDDAASATDTLSALAAKPNVMAACIYTKDGRILARYLRSNQEKVAFPPAPQPDGFHFGPTDLSLSRRILLDGETLGTVYLTSDLRVLETRLSRYAGIVALVLLASSLVALAMSFLLQRVISSPILQLARTVELVSSRRDYSVRAKGTSGDDELGRLIDGFNQMLEEIQGRDAALRETHDDLEQRVEEGSRELQLEIAEKKLGLETLRESEERYRVLFEGNPLPMWLYAPDRLVILAANQAAVKQYGYTHKELVGLSLEDLHPTQGAARVKGQESRRDGVVRHRRKDGTILDVDVRSDDIVLGGRRLRLALLLDVSDRTRLEERYRQAQKMEAVGRLAGGVAHDFNNLLTVILGYGDLLSTQLVRGTPEHESLEQVLTAANRAAELTRQLLAFSRKQVLSPCVLDLGVVAAEMDRMLRRVIGEDVELVMVLQQGLGQVMADRGQIEQIIMNLAVNARDAMPKGGKLTIEVRNVEPDGDESEESQAIGLGPWVMLSVSDNGIGMDEATKAHIFEPFFTTKERGKGTGLGLSTVDGIVEQSGGLVRVTSAPGQGTTFRIYLPRTEESEEKELLRAATGKLAAWGNETVLLVEDEPAVQRLARDVLTRAGYTVLMPPDSQSAETVAREHPGPIQLLLTDVVMPQLGGPELAARVRALRPDVRILFMSGYSNEAVAHHGVLEEGAAFLEKPFTPSGLLKKVRDVLMS